MGMDEFYKHTTRQITKLLLLLQNHSNFSRINFMLIKSNADFLLDIREVKLAISAFHKLKIFCQYSEMWKEKIQIYQQMGYCY
jgi:hypothetical protein